MERATIGRATTSGVTSGRRSISMDKKFYSLKGHIQVEGDRRRGDCKEKN